MEETRILMCFTLISADLADGFVFETKGISRVAVVGAKRFQQLVNPAERKKTQTAPTTEPSSSKRFEALRSGVWWRQCQAEISPAIGSGNEWLARLGCGRRRRDSWCINGFMLI